MVITWYGHACFKIQTRPKRGEKEVTVFIDPFDKATGLKPPQGKADLVVVSHSHHDHNNDASLKGAPFVVDAPGEYALKGVNILGIDSFHDDKQGELRGRNTITILESEGMRICHLGDLGHLLEENQVEKIGDVDVLMVPVGGTYTLDAKLAKKVVKQIEPAIIIPMHYKLPGLKLKIADEREFIKLMGVNPGKKQEKLNLKKKDIEGVENELILMKRKQ